MSELLKDILTNKSSRKISSDDFLARRSVAVAPWND